MKYCTDCRHFEPPNEFLPRGICWNEKTRRMDGAAREAQGIRLYGPCDVEAKFFEPKPVVVPTRSCLSKLFGRK